MAKRGAVVTGRRGSRRGIDRSMFEVVIERRKGGRCSERKSKVTARRSVYMAVRPRAVQLSRFLGFPAPPITATLLSFSVRDQFWSSFWLLRSVFYRTFSFSCPLYLPLASSPSSLSCPWVGLKGQIAIDSGNLSTGPTDPPAIVPGARQGCASAPSTVDRKAVGAHTLQQQPTAGAEGS